MSKAAQIGLPRRWTIECMGESKNDNRRHQEQPEPEIVHRISHQDRPYWKRAHRDWRFWVSVTFIFAALFIYITSDNLALVPGK